MVDIWSDLRFGAFGTWWSVVVKSDIAAMSSSDVGVGIDGGGGG